MDKKKVIVAFSIATVFLLAVGVFAASSYYKPSKYKGLDLGTKGKPTAAKAGPCADFGPCGLWHTVVGDKTSKKGYRCTCRVPSLSKDNVICLMSPTVAKKAGYKVEECRK